MTTLNEDLTPKIIEFQHEVIPKAKTIAVLFNPVNPTNPVYVDKLRSAASAIGITVLPVELKSRETLDAVFSTIVAQHPDALHLVSDSGNIDLSDRIAELALAQRLPSFSTVPSYAQFGGLIAYGASWRQLFIRSCYFVKRILDGANPGELPVEQPTRIELVINLKTAKALGLDVPLQLQQLADELIE